MEWIARLNRVAGRVPLGAGGSAAEVFHWAYQRNLPDNVPHRHTYFEVCLVGSHGTGRFLVEGRAHSIAPGTLFVARPGVVHQIVNTSAPLMEIYWVSFAWDASGGGEVADVLARFADAADVLTVPDAGEHLGAVWRGLRAAAEHPVAGGAVGDAQLTALMSAVLLGVAALGGGASLSDDAPAPSGEPASALARVAVRYIQDNLNRPLTVPEVAAYLHVSPRHLARLFRGFTGVPPAAYIEQARMDRARSLLLHAADPIKRVAAAVGYGDVHHFSRVFARRFGCPPGRYRDTNGAADTTPRGPDLRTPGALV